MSSSYYSPRHSHSLVNPTPTLPLGHIRLGVRFTHPSIPGTLACWGWDSTSVPGSIVILVRVNNRGPVLSVTVSNGSTVDCCPGCVLPDRLSDPVLDSDGLVNRVCLTSYPSWTPKFRNGVGQFPDGSPCYPIPD